MACPVSEKRRRLVKRSRMDAAECSRSFCCCASASEYSRRAASKAYQTMIARAVSRERVSRGW
jgi:hypothetical protein